MVSSVQSLDKQINKPPLRCRFGFHDYALIEKTYGVFYHILVERCLRCEAERSITEEVE